MSYCIGLCRVIDGDIVERTDDKISYGRGLKELWDDREAIFTLSKNSYFDFNTFESIYEIIEFIIKWHEKTDVYAIDEYERVLKIEDAPKVRTSSCTDENDKPLWINFEVKK